RRRRRRGVGDRVHPGVGPDEADRRDRDRGGSRRITAGRHYCSASGLTPCRRSASSGSTGSPPPGRISRWTCEPVTLPVAPTYPITWSRVTFSPTVTPNADWWA